MQILMAMFSLEICAYSIKSVILAEAEHIKLSELSYLLAAFEKSLQLKCFREFLASYMFNPF